MSKHKDGDMTIPEDIAATAKWIAADQCGADCQCIPGPCKCRDQIANALIEERQRCAAIAVGWGKINDENGGYVAPMEAASDIAALILTPSTVKKEGK